MRRYNLHKGILSQLEVLVGMYDPDNSIIGESFVHLAPYLKVRSPTTQFLWQETHTTHATRDWDQ